MHGSITASNDPAEIPPFDLGIIATKAPGLEEAAATLEGHFPGATMMTTLNGLGAEEIVRAHGDWPIISAVTFMSGTRHDDTHVEYILDTETWLGPVRGHAVRERRGGSGADRGRRAEGRGAAATCVRRSGRS